MRGRKPLIADRYHCNTLLSWALVSLREELGATSTDIAESLDVNTVTFTQWMNGKSFPEDIDTFHELVRQYPSIREMGDFNVLRNDYMEFRGFNNPRPTSGLIQYCKSIGLTYYKSKGQFEPTVPVNEQRKIDKKVTRFKAFLDAIETAKEGKFLSEELLKEVKLPSDMKVNFDCIEDDNEYERVFNELNARADELSKLSWQFRKRAKILKGLKEQYKLLSLTTDIDSEIERTESKIDKLSKVQV